MKRCDDASRRYLTIYLSFFDRALSTQVLQPLALGPLYHAKKFILVGDPQQLPPVVTSKVALEGGMDESLMSALMPAAAKCLVDLNMQYRSVSTLDCHSAYRHESQSIKGLFSRVLRDSAPRSVGQFVRHFTFFV